MTSAERDRGGRIPLHYAALEDDVDLMAAELAAGADVDDADRAGMTPLHFAAQQYEVAAARLLLEHGAAIDPRDKKGSTPLVTAVFNSRGRGDMIRLLRDAGADPYAVNEFGVIPVELARRVANFDIAQYFADLPAE